MRVKNFSELNQSKRKSTKASKSKSIVASVKRIAETIDTVDATVNRIHKAFNEPNATFSKEQVEKIMLSCRKMNASLSNDLNETYQNLKVAIHEGLPNDTIAEQIEALSALRAKLAIVRAHAAGSLGLVKAEGEEEDFVELDENGMVVDDFDPVDEMVEPEPMVEEEAAEETASSMIEEGEGEGSGAPSQIEEGEVDVTPEVTEHQTEGAEASDETASDETASDETASDEIVSDETASEIEGAEASEETASETQADETASDETASETVAEDDDMEDMMEEEEEMMEEAPMIEVDDAIDDVVMEELMEEPMMMDEDEMEEEVEASLQAKKIATASKTSGGKSPKNDPLEQMIKEEMRP